MKKYLLSAAILFTISASAIAQSSTFGIKGGVNFSKVDADNLNSSTVSGYQAGLFGRFGSGLYLQPELYVSSTGGKFQSANGLYNGDVKFTNLNVPLLLGTKIGSNSLNFRLMVGPVYTYTINKS